MYMIVLIVWFIGFILSYLMQRAEVYAEDKVYTVGDRALNVLTSLLSFIWILVILTSAWVKQLGALGYWNKQIK